MPDSAPSSRSRTRQVLASESRLRLLDLLTGAGRGMHAGELAAQCGLHVSTVRFHLDGLRSAGLVDTHTETPGGRGRPRLMFRAVSRAVAAAVPGNDAQAFSGYEHLARVLAAAVAAGDDQPAAMRRAHSAGRQWAAELVAPPHSKPSGEHHGVPTHHADAADAAGSADSVHSAATKVNGLFARLGFDPELRTGSGRTDLLLHACPFEAVVADHPEVACSLHLGLLEGALDQLGAESAGARLEGPFSGRPCVVRMAVPSGA